MPRPIVVLAVVLAASVALGAWLNDNGPWAEPAPPTAASGTVVVLDPSTGAVVASPGVASVPLGDAERTIRLVRGLFGDGIDAYSFDGTWNSEGTDHWPTEFRGMCSMDVAPDVRGVTLYWKDGAVPPPVRQRVAEAAGEFTLTVESTMNSRAEIRSAAKALRVHGPAALARAGRQSGTGVPAGLSMVVYGNPDPQWCGGVGVGYGRPGQRALPENKPVEGAVERTLEKYTHGVVVNSGAVRIAKPTTAPLPYGQ